jgi:hypothetical protein
MKMTAGFKSTEFWMGLATLGVGSWLAQAGVDLNTLLGVTSPAVVYIGGRSFVKGREAKP